MDFNKFKDKKIVVLGDMIADEYIYGETARISREAPVLILEQQHQEIRPGGAANVVANIKAMGGQPIPVGAVGGDDYGGYIWEYFRNNDISTQGLKIDEYKGHRTIVKTRLMAGSHNTVCQQVLRLDRKQDELRIQVRAAMEEEFYNLLKSADALVISDYGEGTIQDHIISNLHRLPAAVPIIVDSRYRIGSFEGCHTLIPNVDEIRAATLNNNIGVAITNLLERTRAANVLLKQGKNGITFASVFASVGEDRFSIDAYGPDEVADVTGAGDTVLAAYTLGMLSDPNNLYDAA